MQHTLDLLLQGFSKTQAHHTQTTLGDRSQYVGMSDIGKAVDCMRMAVADKAFPHESHTTKGDNALERHLWLQRGHWFEQGITEALRATGVPLLSQLAIHARHGSVPIQAHLDLVLVPAPDRVHIVEVKSCETLPETAYAAHEMQVLGQAGLLHSCWGKPLFFGGSHTSKQGVTFPALVQQLLGVTLPAKVQEVSITSEILAVSMKGVHLFGPYTPNKLMLDAAQNLAMELWQHVQAVKAGHNTLATLPTAQGWHPLCEYCQWNADCPRFAGISMPELEQELLELQELKVERDTLAQRIQQREQRLKGIHKASGLGAEWIQAQTRRFKALQCEGKVSLDKEKLASALAEMLPEQTVEGILLQAQKVGAPYQRLMVGTVNG